MPRHPPSSNLPMKELARSLRRNATDAERLLWQRLRNRQLDGHKARRQEVIGPFIVDFVFTRQRLVIEVDGGQHAESPDDGLRTAWLEDQGYRVLRFWNHEVLTNTEGVLEVIRKALGTGAPPLTPAFSPRGERE